MSCFNLLNYAIDAQDLGVKGKSLIEYQLRRYSGFHGVTISRFVSGRDFNHAEFWKKISQGNVNTELELIAKFEETANSLIPEKNREMQEMPPKIPQTEPVKHIPKDGDSIAYHVDHNVVNAQAGGISYKYCRDCKVEVEDVLDKVEDWEEFNDWRL